MDRFQGAVVPLLVEVTPDGALGGEIDREVTPLADPDAGIARCDATPDSAKVESRGGESWFLSGLHFTNYNHADTPNSRHKPCATPLNNDAIQPRSLSHGIIPATSGHSGGVNVLLMDGSGRFVLDGVNKSV